MSHGSSVAGSGLVDISERHIICDLDGVVWLEGELLSGAAEALSRLTAAGWITTFVTNFSYGTTAQLERALSSQGVDAAGRVLTSADAVSSLLTPSSRVMVVGGPGLVEAVARASCELTEDPESCDAVIVGMCPELNFDLLTRAIRAVAGGATLIGSNGDPTYPTRRGPLPGGGAILAAIGCTTATPPVLAGKPHRPMVDLLRGRLGSLGHESWVIGDRLSTDGEFARELGCRFAHVDAGTATETLDPERPIPVAWRGPNIGSAVEVINGC